MAIRVVLSTCRDCGSSDPRAHFEGDQLCDRCLDRRIARLTGMPELGEPPPPFVLTGPDGRPHELRPRAWRVPTGIVAEVEETGVPRGQGFRFSVFGAHNSDVAGLIGRARAQAEKEIGRQYLEPSSHRLGWVLRGDEVAGRLVWSGEGPYDVRRRWPDAHLGRSLAWPSSPTRAVGSGS